MPTTPIVPICLSDAQVAFHISLLPVYIAQKPVCACASHLPQPVSKPATNDEPRTVPTRPGAPGWTLRHLSPPDRSPRSCACRRVRYSLPSPYHQRSCLAPSRSQTSQTLRRPSPCILAGAAPLSLPCQRSPQSRWLRPLQRLSPRTRQASSTSAWRCCCLSLELQTWTMCVICQSSTDERTRTVTQWAANKEPSADRERHTVTGTASSLVM